MLSQWYSRALTYSCLGILAYPREVDSKISISISMACIAILLLGFDSTGGLAIWVVWGLLYVDSCAVLEDELSYYLLLLQSMNVH
jgi:hypothetical protein